MTTQRGLSGGSVLESHLGFSVPSVVRRGTAPTPSPESPPAEQPAPEQAPVEVPTMQNPTPAIVAHQLVEERAVPPLSEPKAAEEHEVAELVAAPDNNVLRIKKQGKGAIARSAYRVGTQKNPYQRGDGTQTQKITFTGPWGLKRELERFCIDRDVSRSEWIVATLREAMARESRASKRQQQTG